MESNQSCGSFSLFCDLPTESVISKLNCMVEPAAAAAPPNPAALSSPILHQSPRAIPTPSAMLPLTAITVPPVAQLRQGQGQEFD